MPASGVKGTGEVGSLARRDDVHTTGTMRSLHRAFARRGREAQNVELRCANQLYTARAHSLADVSRRAAGLESVRLVSCQRQPETGDGGGLAGVRP